jgi:hypothetical protein
MQLDSVGWGQEDVEAELLGWSGKQGAARNGDEERRPWRLGFGCALGKKSRGGRERRGRSRGERGTVAGVLILVQGAVVSILADDGEAAHRAASASTRSCFRS